jgi:hypothetical protein
MKRLIFSLMLAFAVIGGAVTVFTAATNPVYAQAVSSSSTPVESPTSASASQSLKLKDYATLTLSLLALIVSVGARS